MSSLTKAVAWKRTGRDSNPRPFGSRANALPPHRSSVGSVGLVLRLGLATVRFMVWVRGNAREWKCPVGNFRHCQSPSDFIVN